MFHDFILVHPSSNILLHIHGVNKIDCIIHLNICFLSACPSVHISSTLSDLSLQMHVTDHSSDAGSKKYKANFMPFGLSKINLSLVNYLL